MVQWFLKNWAELPYHPLLGTYNSTSGYILKELKTRTWIDIYTPMFIAELFTIAKRRKQPKCPSTNKWINKMWYTHAIEYYSALRRNPDTCYNTDECLRHYAKWNRPQNDKYCMIPLTWGTQSSQIHRDRKWYGGFQMLREVGDGEFMFNGYRASVRKGDKSSGDGWWWLLHTMQTY